MSDENTAPQETKTDIQDGDVISIAGRVTDIHETDKVYTDVLFEDRAGREVKLRVFDDDANADALSEASWYLFVDAKGEIYNGERMINSNRGAISIEPLDSPPGVLEASDEPHEADPDASDTDEASSAASSWTNTEHEPVLGFDIETLSTVPEENFDFENPDHTEVLCIGVAQAPAPGVPGDQTVIFRGGTTVESEQNLLSEFLSYVDAVSPDHLVTFRGSFDQTHLIGRADRVGGEDMADQYRALFADERYTDLTPPGSLEDNANVPDTHWDVYAHELDPTDWREGHPNWDATLPIDTSRVINKDIPEFGKAYLELEAQSDLSEAEDRQRRALRELLRHYTETDVAPLPHLLSRGRS